MIKNGQVDTSHSPHERIQTTLPREKSQHRSANLDCFKMLTLPVIWRIPNQREEEFFVFSEATRLFQLCGLVKNRLLFVRVVLKQKQFLWTLVCLDGIPALGLWDIVMCVLEPQSYGNLMRHPKKMQHTSKNNSVTLVIEDLNLFSSECTYIHPTCVSVHLLEIVTLLSR